MSILLLAVASGIAPGAAAGVEIQLVVDRPLPPVAQAALDELRRAAASQGHESRVVAVPDAGASHTIVVGIAGKSSQLDGALAADQVSLSVAPESLAVRRVGEGGKSLLAAGRDPRGLSYALREIARCLELTGRDEDPLAHVIEESASPSLAVRNVSIHLFNSDVERRWYFDEEFWRDYFRMLALHRFNQFTLTFSDQTNYLCPLYACLLEMPEYPTVRVAGSIAEERTKQLAMLRRITELAAEHGLDFNLGIWMQAPVPRYSAPVQVTGLPEGKALAEYCALGLRRLLSECPSIRGVQLRMNDEAGVSEGEQTEFFRPIFQAVRAANRPIRLELRYKGLQPSTTQAALDEKLDVTISTKFWAEHFGLPYHPTSADSHYRKDRYSFGALLRHPRAYRVTYQLWNVGSQRLTLWGDPEYARRFAASCRLGGGEGFEVFAPLTNQGYGNRPGEWNALRDPAYRVGRWDQERYWLFYLSFGRMGFDPDTNPQVWRREFRRRFGNAAEHVEQAYREASKVLPLITAARLPGASEWRWWPEMDTGGSLREYMHIQPSDPAQFYAIRGWKQTAQWRWEDWDQRPGFVEDVMSGKVTGKWTPEMVAERLEQTAAAIESQWHSAAAARRSTPEWRITEVDHRLLGELARYHAATIRAATQLAFFESDQQVGRLKLAEDHARSGLDAWKRIVALTEPVYHHDLVFGLAADSPRSTFGHHHTGHWRDRLAEVEANVTYLGGLRAAHERGGNVKPVQPWPLETREARPALQVKDGIVAMWRSDGGLDLKLKPLHDANLTRVVLHDRPLDQTRDWRERNMRADGGGWIATIPADEIDPRFELQCRVELLGEHGGTLWPAWEAEQPYVVLRRPSK